MQLKLPQPTIGNVVVALVGGLVILVAVTGVERGALIGEINAVVHYPLGWIEAGRRWQAWLAASAITWVVAAWGRG